MLDLGDAYCELGSVLASFGEVSDLTYDFGLRLYAELCGAVKLWSPNLKSLGRSVLMDLLE